MFRLHRLTAGCMGQVLAREGLRRVRDSVSELRTGADR